MSRDTQFAGFATLLALEIRDNIRQLYSEFGLEPDSLIDLNIHKIEPAIARRAYDLAYHVIDNTSEEDHAFMDSVQGLVNRIPDMAELPREVAE